MNNKQIKSSSDLELKLKKETLNIFKELEEVIISSTRINKAITLKHELNRLNNDILMYGPPLEQIARIQNLKKKIESEAKHNIQILSTAEELLERYKETLHEVLQRSIMHNE